MKIMINFYSACLQFVEGPKINFKFLVIFCNQNFSKFKF